MIRFDFPRSPVQGQGHQNENGLIGIVVFLSLSTIKIIISIQYYIAFLDNKLLKADDLFSTESISSLIRFHFFFKICEKREQQSQNRWQQRPFPSVTLKQKERNL